MPEEVINAIVAIIKTGKEATVKMEHGRWIVLENFKRVVFSES